MTGKDFLKQIRDINITIIGLQLEIERLDTSLTNTTVKPKEVDVQTSLPSDPMADKIIEKVEYENKLIDAMNRQIKVKTAALDMLDRMESQEDKAALILRYINCMTHKDMSDKMDCSVSSVKNKLRIAEGRFNAIYSAVVV